ncbi:Uncharacterised protein [Chlamydia trachomatis]|nr:Uncharacterised protein [Chlamydia trachomatis]
METSLAFINSFVAAKDGLETEPTICSGAPASTAAFRTRSTAALLQRFADGCGANTIALRDLIAIIALKITVEVGLVDGVIPSKSPIGSATLNTLFFSSTSRMPEVCMSLIS